ncbi:MAG: DUF1674 domain-containing protein [Pseudomonadota bacterium]
MSDADQKTDGTTAADRPAQAAQAAQAQRKPLPDAAKRALAEAEARREAAKATQTDGAQGATEIQGREGPDPVRYGDWENKGIASDF